MNADFESKIKLFSPLQGDNLSFIYALLKILRLHCVVTLTYLGFFSVYFFFFDLHVSSDFAKYIPSLYRGKDLIVLNSSVEFYNFAGLVYFLSEICFFIFIFRYVYEILSYRFKIRFNKYEKSDLLLSILLSVLFALGLFFVFIGNYNISDIGRFNEIYRGEYFMGIAYQIVSIPFFLFVLFYLSTVQFFILTKRNGPNKN